MRKLWIKSTAVICAAALFVGMFSGSGTLVAEAAASDWIGQSNVFLDAGGYKTVPYGTVTSDWGVSYKQRADVLPKLEKTYLTDEYLTEEVPVSGVPTSDWVSSVVFDQFSESLYVHPMAFRANGNGMMMSTPEVKDVLAPRGDHEPAVESLLEVETLVDKGLVNSVELVLGGEGFTAADARLAASTDWSYEISMRNEADNAGITTTLVKGSAYSWYEFDNVTPTLSLGGGATNLQIYINNTSSNNIGVQLKEEYSGTSQTHYYGVYAPAGTTWTINAGKLTADLPDGKDWLAIAALPDGETATFDAYAQYASNRIVDTIVEWDYSEAESLVTTTYNFLTKNLDTGAEGGNTIMALYPHQWRYATEEDFSGCYEYDTVRGTMKTLIGKEYSTYMTYNGILAAMPTPESEEGVGTLVEQICYWVDWFESPTGGDGKYSEAGDGQYGGYDTYWMGKNLNKRADMVYMMEQIDTSSMSDEDKAAWEDRKEDVYTALRDELQYWFNPADCYTVEANPFITGFFYYYDDFGTLIGYNSSYSSDSELNDHHFHYGYWVKAAAAVAQYYDKYPHTSEADKWEKEWGAMVYEMISDFANPNRDGTSLNEQRTDVEIDDTKTRYPFLRNFDIYEGHSWASGVANYEYNDETKAFVDPALTGGNNQESTSEAVNAWSSLILWGETVGDERIRDLGIYLYTTEVAAIEDYYFDVHDEVFTDGYEDADGFDLQVVTRLYGGRYDHTAWWTEDPIEATTIHMIPMTGSTLYFAKYPEKIKDTINSLSESGLQWTNYMARKNGIGGEQWNEARYMHHDLLAEFYALADPQAGMDSWDITLNYPDTTDPVVEFGETRAHTYGFIQSLIEYGTPNFEITGSTPLSMAFSQKDEQGNVTSTTYVAQNLTETEQRVYFSDGTFIDVPANSSYAGAKSGDGENPDLKGKVYYTVETYLEKLDGTGYEKTSETKRAAAGEITLEPAAIEGFTFDAGHAENWLTDTLVEGEDNAVTLKAYYSRNTYTVTYENMEDATNHVDNPEEYTYGEEFTLGEPTRTGYRFLGWYADENFSQEFTGITATTNGPLTVYAKWISETSAMYTVQVYKQNTACNGYDLTSEETLVGEIGSNVTASYSGDITGFTLNEAKSEKSGVVKSGDGLVLSLYYDRNSYNVFYGNMDGATNAVGNAGSYIYGVGLTLIAPVKEGYTFGGWFTDEACTVGNEKASISTTETGDVTVYAKWTETPEDSGDNGDTNITRDDITVIYNESTKRVTVTLSGQTGLNDVICYIAPFANETAAKEACAAATAAIPGISLTGHFGVRLTISADGTSASKEIMEFTIDEGGYIVFGLNINGSLSTDSGFYYYKVGGQTLTSYTVNHFQQNVSLSSYTLADSSVVSNVAVGKTVTATANTYDGFNYNAGMSTASGTTTSDGGLILNLYYDRNKYDIVYNGLEDATNPNPTQYAHGVGLELQPPTREGYIFAGWYTDADCTEGNEITAIPITSTGTVTVYAKWTEDGTGGGSGGEEPVQTVNYTVKYYLQNTTLDAYVESDAARENLTAEEGAAVSAEVKNFTGFTHDSTIQGTLLSGNASEGLELAVYYNRNTYAVTYHNMDEAENPAANAGSYIYGVGLTFKNPERTGYAFGGWYTSSDCAPESRIHAISDTQIGDVDVYAKWTEEVYAALYTVDYYLQDTSLESYTKQHEDAVTAYGTIGATVDAPILDYVGFTKSETAEHRKESGVVAEDGSLALKVYYDRNIYPITYKNMDNATLSEESRLQYIYGEETSLGTAVKDGYRFDGWYTDKSFAAGTEIAVIPAGKLGEVTVYAKWVVENVDYQVKYYLQNKTLSGYEEVKADAATFTSESGETVNAEVKEYTGFTYNEAASTATGVVAEDGSLVLKVYYSRNKYAVTYENMTEASNAESNKSEYIYGVGMTLEEPSKEGFVFGGWYTDSTFAEESKIAGISADAMAPVTVYAKWLEEESVATYQVEYYLQDTSLDGYELMSGETFRGNGVIGENVSAPAKTFEGFVKNSEVEGTLESAEIIGDGTLVLKVYYDRIKYGIVYHNIDNEETYNSESNLPWYAYGVGLALKDPARNGYIFEGWYLDADFTKGNKVDRISAEQTGTMELYAKWTDKSELLWTVDDVQDFDYTGKKITPVVVVRDRETGAKLDPKKDYTVKYQNNVNAGTATIVVTGKGNYTGTRNIFFEINPIDLSEDATVTVEDIYKFATGKAVKMSPVVKWGSKKLKLNKDFRIDTSVEGSAASYKDVGEYRIALEGMGNYTGSISVKAVLADKKTTILISKAKITGLVNYTYDSTKDVQEYIQNLMVTYKGAPLSEGIHYSLEYVNNTQAGTAKVIVRGLMNGSDYKFTGSKTLSFKINGEKLNAKNVTIPQMSYTYTGAEIEPVVTITNKAGAVIPWEQYTVSYSKNVDVGTATITITGKDGYQGTVKKTFKITPLDVSSESVIKNVKQAEIYFEKSGATTEVELIYNGEVLTENVDYTLAYANNKVVGNGTVTIKGKGNFGGSKPYTFVIGRKNLGEVVITATDVVYASNKKISYYLSKPVLTDASGKTLVAGKDYNKVFIYELQQADGTFAAVKDTDVTGIVPGSILRVKVTTPESSCYTGTHSITYRVIGSAQNIKSARVTIEPQLYTGRAVTLTKEDIVSVEVKLNGSYVALSPDDYEIVEGSYKNNVKKGTAKVTIKGVGEYGGYKEASFKIQSKSIEDTSFISRILGFFFGKN